MIIWTIVVLLNTKLQLKTLFLFQMMRRERRKRVKMREKRESK